jgi:hypothetical protein
MQAFPNLEKTATDERSIGSTATTTSLTAATDDAIRKVENQWTADKDTFSVNLETTLNNQLAKMYTKLQSKTQLLKLHAKQSTLSQCLASSPATTSQTLSYYHTIYLPSIYVLPQSLFAPDTLDKAE